MDNNGGGGGGDGNVREVGSVWGLAGVGGKGKEVYLTTVKLGKKRKDHGY